MHIGLFVERTRAYGRRLCEGIAAFASEHTDIELDMLNWEELPRLRRNCDFDAFIARIFDDDMASKFMALGKPVVDVFYGKERKEFAIVDLDNAAIAKTVAEHFRDRGFKNFAYCGYDGVKFSDDRRNAFEKEVRTEGDCYLYHTPPGAVRTFASDVVKNERYSLGLRENQSLVKWLRKLPKPIAVFCSHDLRAHQLLGICRKNGFRVPEDIALVGCDNDLILCDLISPALTSIDPDGFEVGRMATEFAMRMVNDPAVDASTLRRLIPPKKLYVRASSEVYPIKPTFLSDALVFINRHYRESIGASDVFRHLGRAHTHVEAAFRRNLGITVQRAIVKKRIEEAVQLLRSTEMSVIEIAEAVGFSSSQYFCRAFKAETGYSPLSCRRHR